MDFFFLHGDQSHETILIRERMRKLKFYYQIRWTVITNLLYYKVRHGLLQIATIITKCDGFIRN